jgi:hypothetical protein
LEKVLFSEVSDRDSRSSKMRDGRESLIPSPNFNTPVIKILGH